MSENSFSLIVALPGEEPIAHELQGDAITFGRSPENQIQVLVAEVSVRHGQLVREGDGYRVVDPGSTNGTRVNGQPIGPEGVVLNPMDRLLLGTLVPAYFVPSSMLVANAPAKLIATIEASAAPARVKTAPVSIASPAAVPLGAPAPVVPGGPATVKLDQLRAPGPGVRPAPVPTAPRLPAAPAAVAPAAAPAPLRPPGVAPVTPVAPVAPVAPANAPAAPGAPTPVRPAAPLAAAIPVKPAAGVIPVNPVSGASTVPIKRVAPSAPTIPLPKKPGE